MPEDAKTEYCIAPSGPDPYVSLAASKKGRIYRKQILPMGKFRHPVTKKPITVDQKFLDTVVANFNAGVVDHLSLIHI